MRGVLLVSIVAAAWLGAGSAAPRAARPGPVIYAVLRGDGILIPVATRTGDRWSNAWPEPAKRVSVPVRLGDLPKRWWGRAEPAAAWHAWLVDGTRTIATVSRPTWYPSLCRKGIGLLTDVTARPPLPRPETSPYPKLGLAATTPQPFQLVETLEAGHPMWTPLTRALARPVADAEARLYLQQYMGEDFRAAFEGGDNGIGRYSKPPRELPGQLRVDRIYRVPVGGGRALFYYEATRRYPEGSPSYPMRCEGLTFASGWFVSGGEVPATLPLNVRLASCEYDGVQVMQPLGYVPDGRGAVLVAQFSSWDRELYAVIRADRQRRDPDVVLTTEGGRCDG